MKVAKFVLLTFVLFAVTMGGESVENYKLKEANSIASETPQQQNQRHAEEYEDDMPPPA